MKISRGNRGGRKTEVGGRTLYGRLVRAGIGEAAAAGENRKFSPGLSFEGIARGANEASVGV